MPSVREISDCVAGFLANPSPSSLEALEDWSAEYSWNIRQRGDEATQSIAYKIRAILNAYSDDSSDDALWQELANAVGPFVEKEATVFL